jgi:hypothetical protein
MNTKEKTLDTLYRKGIGVRLKLLLLLLAVYCICETSLFLKIILMKSRIELLFLIYLIERNFRICKPGPSSRRDLFATSIWSPYALEHVFTFLCFVKAGAEHLLAILTPVMTY